VFGPLQHGMVLSKALLPALVRQTAINANTASRKAADMYGKPFSTRVDLVKEIIVRYKVRLMLVMFISCVHGLHILICTF
jgi:hypothetical protein